MELSQFGMRRCAGTEPLLLRADRAQLSGLLSKAQEMAAGDDEAGCMARFEDVRGLLGMDG